MSEPTAAALELPVSSKKCRKCGQVKHLDAFYRDSQNRDGRRGLCKVCWVARDGARRFANHDSELVREAKFRETNREKLRARGREWARKNMPQQVEYQRQRTAQLKATVLAHYGAACACCGSTYRLAIDHIHGNGREHRIELFGYESAGGRLFYRWLIQNGFPEGYQTLCIRCNTSKNRGPRCRIAHRGAQARAA